jgi:hypothetical protein
MRLGALSAIMYLVFMVGYTRGSQEEFASLSKTMMGTSPSCAATTDALDEALRRVKQLEVWNLELIEKVLEGI